VDQRHDADEELHRVPVHGVGPPVPPQETEELHVPREGELDEPGGGHPPEPSVHDLVAGQREVDPVVREVGQLDLNSVYQGRRRDYEHLELEVAPLLGELSPGLPRHLIRRGE